jgi:hypothetical protein
MAAEISADAFVALCLQLAEGDPEISMSELLRRLEAWQEREDRHFGISRSDVRGALRELAWLLGHNAWSQAEFDALLEGTSSSTWLSEMLKYRAVYFNDEGESWVAESEAMREDPWPFSWQHPEEYRAWETRQALLRMLSGPGSRRPSQYLRVLDTLELGPGILMAASRPGSSS